MVRIIKLSCVVVSLFASLAFSSTADAGSIFLNGVNIDGVTGQKFQNCTVEIDTHGNVQITAKGYAVKGGGSGAAAGSQAPAAPVGGPVNQKYYLVTEKSAPGMTQYDIDLFINGKWAGKFRDDDNENRVKEISKFLKSGTNKIRFIAKKSSAARRSSSANHFFRIVIGRGDSGGRNVMITKKLVDYKRTALETGDQNHEFTVSAQ